jgi:hypothetical protein
MPAVASVAIRAALAGPTRHCRVLGASNHAVWVRVGYDVVVLSSRDATRLPNGIAVSAMSGELALASLEDSWSARIGGGRIAIDGIVAEVARWWDPRPALTRIVPSRLARDTKGLPAAVPGVDGWQLNRALATWSAPHLLEAAGSLLGRGPGLTPEADDYLAGFVAAVRCLAPTLGHTRAASMLDAAAGPLAALAYARTTTFSASLIRHALRGDVAEPAGALLRAFGGRGDVPMAHQRLLGVGHTSGPALAAGLVLGARALTGAVGPGVGRYSIVD